MFTVIAPRRFQSWTDGYSEGNRIPSRRIDLSMSVLVTGGAGYIGSHIVRLLHDRGDGVVVVDDLATGRRDRIPDVPVVQLDLSRSDSVYELEAVLSEYSVSSVIHLAARKQVAESVQRPAWYYQQNIGSLAHVLLAMEHEQVSQLVFSSSAAVYGTSSGEHLSEGAATTPTNPYGETKLIGEWLVADAVKAAGVRAASLRYFNVAGSGWPELGDAAGSNLVPMVFERMSKGLAPVIFGTDYPTPDGTCVRDYVHVLDLAEAHLAVVDSLSDGHARHDIFNVGTGSGSSVLEMVREMLSVTGFDLDPELRERRRGDPSSVVADPTAILDAIGWSAKRGRAEMIESAWGAYSLPNDSPTMAERQVSAQT